MCAAKRGFMQRQPKPGMAGPSRDDEDSCQFASHARKTKKFCKTVRFRARANRKLRRDGDTGGTVASEQSSNRYGIEWANSCMPTELLAVDLDVADSGSQSPLPRSTPCVLIRYHY